MKKNSQTVILLPLVLLFHLGSCTPQDGTDPYALWRTYEHPDKIYHFHYLSPPWRETEESNELWPQFAVAPDDQPLPERGLIGDGLAARCGLDIRQSWADNAKSLAESEREEWIWGGAHAEEARDFESAGGDSGVLIVGNARDRWFMALYYELPRRRVVVLEIAGKEYVDDADLELLLKSLEPRSAEGN